jgi:serine/threonine protein kinase
MKPSVKVRDLRTVGEYELLAKIGTGGMGVVYRARKQDSDGIPVALKLLSPDRLDAVCLKRFEQEFRAALRLDHPNIVEVLDFGAVGDHHFLVMELVQGKSLGTIVHDVGPLAEPAAIGLFIQIADALHHVHQAGLIHRDVKPDNVLIDSDGRPKLTDLGLVKILDEDIDLTRPNTGMGTPNYMAPEQFTNSKHADPRCDIYSLGATLYTAMTGEVPFCASTPLRVLKKKAIGELAPLRSLVPDVSKRVEQTILRAMSLEPGERHASCRDFIAELTGKPVGRSRRDGTIRVVGTPVKEFSGREKRAHARHSAEMASRCLPVAAHEEDAWPTRIHDVSRSGIGLIVTRRFEVGTVLELRLPSQAEGAPRHLLVQVMRQQAQSSRKWLIGCKFASLIDEDELKALRS